MNGLQVRPVAQSGLSPKTRPLMNGPGNGEKAIFFSIFQKLCSFVKSFWILGCWSDMMLCQFRDLFICLPGDNKERLHDHRNDVTPTGQALLVKYVLACFYKKKSTGQNWEKVLFFWPVRNFDLLRKECKKSKQIFNIYHSNFVITKLAEISRNYINS